MIVRKYQSLDCEEMAQLFYDTIHTINRKDYSKEQLDVWADGKVDIESWNQRYLSSHTLVAIEDKRIVEMCIRDSTWAGFDFIKA